MSEWFIQNINDKQRMNMTKIIILISLIYFFIGAVAVRTESYFALNNFTDICYFAVSFFVLFSIISIILFIIEQKDHALRLKDRQSFQIFIGTLISIFIIIVLGYIHIKTDIINNIQYIFANIFIANLIETCSILIVLIFLTIIFYKDYKYASIYLFTELVFLLVLMFQWKEVDTRIEKHTREYCNYFPKTNICVEMNKANIGIDALTIKQKIRMANKVEKIKRKEHIEEIRENKKRKNIEKKEMIKQEKIIQSIKIK